MKKREKLSGAELSTLCRQLKIESADGKKYATDCADTEGSEVYAKIVQLKLKAPDGKMRETKNIRVFWKAAVL